MGLRSGDVVPLPVGWDRCHYTADQRLAVFYLFPNLKREPLPFDLAAGELAREAPNLSKVPQTVFDWSDNRPIKPVFGGERDGNGDAKSSWTYGFAGLSLNGTIFPFDLGMSDARLQDVKSQDGFAGFRVGSGGRPVPGECPPVVWSRLIVVSPNGQRHMTEGFPHGREPAALWFHNSGRVLTGTPAWYDTEFVQKHRLHLVETSLDLAAPR